MAFEQKNGQGAIFKNKKTASNQPDYKGYVLADRDMKAGDKIELACWVKEGKQTGEKYFSVSIGKPREDKPAPTHAAASIADDLDDDLPPF